MSDCPKPSSLQEKAQRLAELEKAFRIYTFRDLGTALAEIHENELYKPAFSSFEDYCVSRWNYKRSQGYRLMDAAAVAKALSPIGDIQKESHARALLAFPPERRAEVWKTALQRARSEGRQLRARDIYDQLVEAKSEVKASEPAADGTVTLDQLRALWEQSGPDVRAAFLEWAAQGPEKAKYANDTLTDNDGDKGETAPIEFGSAGETPVTSPIPETDGEEAQYECDTCEETFDDDSDAVTLYECDDCGVRFTRETSLNGNHQCPECNKFGHRVSNCGCPICNEGELIKKEGEEE